MHCSSAGITKEIEKVLPGRFVGNTQAHFTMIQEQPGVEVIFQVYQQTTLTFSNLKHLLRALKLLILSFTRLPLTAFTHHLLFRNTQHTWNHFQCFE